MAKKDRMTTPKGIAIYPHLTKADTKFDAAGEYHVKLALTEADAAPLVAQLDALVVSAVAQMKEKHPKFAKKMISVAPYDTENEEHPGKVVLKFKMTENVTPKKGDPFTQKPALFDSALKPLPADVRIGGGSIIRVSFEPFPYFAATDKKAGISLRLVAVQVVELREYEANGAKFGFSATDADEDGDDTETEDEGDDTEDGADF